MDREENLEVLSTALPELAEVLSTVSDFDHVRMSETRQGEQNLELLIQNEWRPLHAQYSADREAKKWFRDCHLSNVQVLYVYGLGLAYSYLELQEWLHSASDHYVVYLEDDIAVWNQWVETDVASEMLQDEQVIFVDLSSSNVTVEQIAYELSYYFVHLKYRITALPSYQLYKGNVFDAIQTQLRHRAAFVSYAAGEFLGFGASFFQNCYSNFLRIKGCYTSKHLIDAFKGVPAVICGAGPSLNKNIHLLKELQNKAIIFAGGSAVNALTARGIVPHFSATVDPNFEQFKRMSAHSGYEVPTFFVTRTHREVLDALHGPKMYLPENGSYPISRWFEEALGIEAWERQDGCNVLHLTMDLARQMGCNPIIFVGMDLAFTGLKNYADSVVSSTQVSQESITSGEDLNSHAFVRTGFDGTPVHTLWKWVAESNYTSTYIKSFPETRFINSTEGGLGVKGLPNLPLKSVLSTLPDLEQDLRNWVHTLIQKGALSDSSADRVHRCFDDLEKSLSECLETCQEMDQCFLDLKTALKEGEASKVECIKEAISTNKQKLEGEFAYTQVLDPVHQVRSVLMERKWHELERDENCPSELDKLLERCEYSREEIRALHKSAEVNLACLKSALQAGASCGVL